MISILRKLKRILTRDEKGKLAGLILGSLVLSLSEVFSIGILIPIMVLFVNPEKVHANRILASLYNFTGAPDDKYFFAVLIVSAIVLFTLKSVYSVFMLYAQQKVIVNTYSRLTRDIFFSYLTKPYSFYLSTNSSVSFKNIIAEVSQFAFGFLASSIVIISESIVFLGILVFLLAVYTTATLLFISVFGMVMVLVGLTLRKRIAAYSAERDKYGQKVYKTAMESLASIKEIQVYGAQGFFTDKLSQEAERYTNSQMKFTVVSAVPRFILETILFGAVLLFILGSMLVNKSFSDLVPLMTLIAMASIRLIPSISKIYSNVNLVQFYTYSMDIIHGILKDDSAYKALPPASGHKRAIAEPSQSIRLANVTFRYESAHQPIFEKLDLAIPLQHAVAVVGSTGAGKSTLIDLIMGLLTPSEGALYYAGTAIDKENIVDYRRKIGYVPQHIALIDDTIEANVAFGVPRGEIDHKSVEHAIKVAQLEPFVKSLPAGMKTEVGERGVRLSGGQRQRIGIARALCRNPELIILDEATSALDKHTEEDFYTALANMERRPTIILVTHRLSTLEHADLIFVMEDGKLAAQGNLKELLENAPVFQKMTNQKIISETRE